MTEITRPSLEYTLKVDGENKVIKMTYGLFTEVMMAVPDPEEIGALIVSNPGLRDYIIRRVLTGNKRVTGEADLVDQFELDIDVRDLDDLLTWVVDHILYFFMTSAAKTAALGEKYQETLTQLRQSKSGAES